MNILNKNEKTDSRLKDSIFSFKRFIFYFIISGFVVTASFFLFFSESLFETSNSPVLIPEGTIQERALRTLFNIFFICLFLSIIDGIRRRVYTYRPVKRILASLSKITTGDFSVRIQPLHKKRAFNEYDLIIEDINKMAQELSTIEALKTDFISNVSHEIKTPLSVIHNYATMLKSETLTNEERLNYAERLEAASKELSDLITGILKLNKLENQQIFPQKKKFNLSEQLCQALLIYENEWTEKELKIITELDENIFIKADEELFLTVWSNLISNAVKFSNHGGTVSVKLSRQNKAAIVSIADNGCGINEASLSLIFEKFYQEDTSHTTKGNGLGLALVKRIINITSSEISVESRLGKGSVFTVKIPLE